MNSSLTPEEQAELERLRGNEERAELERLRKKTDTERVELKQLRQETTEQEVRKNAVKNQPNVFKRFGTHINKDAFSLRFLSPKCAGCIATGKPIKNCIDCSMEGFKLMGIMMLFYIVFFGFLAFIIVANETEIIKFLEFYDMEWLYPFSSKPLQK